MRVSSKTEYRKHKYSGPRPSKKKVQAGLKSSATGVRSRLSAWRNKDCGRKSANNVANYLLNPQQTSGENRSENKMSTELDKFKRRVIRTVARVLRQGGQEKMADAAMWEGLQKEVGCDCKLLWERMRTLTLKKMKRLLPAEDRLRNIAEVAQMQLTDWLLFDLVLVHEDIEVISDDPESKPMKDLVNLVKKFDIEGKQGDSLTTAWTAATFYYNSFGRQCSPMLLQRRWYQLKKATRSKFYKFWSEYRGNMRLLNDAKKNFMPNELDSLIAQRYPYLVTLPFKEWDELIKEKLVILPEEFEAKMRNKSASSDSKDINEPDLVLVEPQVETIELDMNSDSESENSKDVDQADVKELKIKKEVKEDIEIDIEPTKVGGMDERMDGPEDDEGKTEHIGETETSLSVPGDYEIEVEPKNQVTNEIVDNTAAVEDDVDGNMADDTEQSAQQESQEVLVEFQANEDVEKDYTSAIPKNVDEEIVMPQITSVFGNVTVANEKLVVLPPVKNVRSNITESNEAQSIYCDENLEDVIRRKAAEFTKAKAKVIKDTPSQDIVKHNIEIPIANREQSIDLQSVQFSEIIKKEEVQKNIESIGNALSDFHADLNFIDDGIEFVDDGIECEDDNDEEVQVSAPVKIKTENEVTSDADDKNSPNFDIKLLMQPLVYSLKLEDMSILKNRDIQSVNDKNIIEIALKESKPIFPITKTVKKEICEDGVDDDKPSQEDEEHINSESESDDKIPENKKVKLSSYLLRKPRKRSYNPIQLCKNPDFNTRLKRLTFSFLSSTRNLTFLRMLKPMTIDLSKAFEDKLINGTLYLKAGEGPIGKQDSSFSSQSEQAMAVLPSLLPVQNLIDNIIDQNIKSDPVPDQPKPQEPKVSERQKTITLPDINNVRRINQQLLTAEVTPMISNTNNKNKSPPLVSLAIAQNKEPANNDIKIDYEIDSKSHLNLGIVPRVAGDSQKPPGIPDLVSKDILEKVKEIDEITAIREKKKSGPKGQKAEMAGGSSSKQKKDNRYQKTYSRKFTNAQRLPWNEPQKSAIYRKEEHLLTIDTLQKMLILMADSDNLPAVLRSKQLNKACAKKKLDLETKLIRYELALKNSKEQEKLMDGTTKSVASETGSNKSVAPETGTKISEASETEVTKEPPAKRSKADAKSDPYSYGEYCCWAKIKMTSEELAILKKHLCPRICECCCREQLASKTKWSLKEAANSTEIVISDDEEGKKIDNTIENVIKASVHEKCSNKKRRPRKPNISEKKLDKPSEKKKTDFSIQCTLDAPIEGALQECASATKSIELNTFDKDTIIKPVINIVNQPKRLATKVMKEVISLDDGDHGTQNEVGKLGRGQSLSLTSALAQTPVLETINQIHPGMPVQGHIIIDGTDRLTVKSKNYITGRPSQNSECFKISGRKMKDKIIYLNSKQSEPQMKSPIFLGENKILLTDVKFPKEMVALPVISSAAPVVNPVSLAPKTVTNPVEVPPGFHLVLLPTGALTYSLDPGVELSEEQKANIPFILEALQRQLIATGSVPLHTKLNTSTEPNVAGTILDNIDLTQFENDPSLAKNDNNPVTTDQLTDTQEAMVDKLSIEKTSTNTIAADSNPSEKVEAPSSILRNMLNPKNDQIESTKQNSTSNDGENLGTTQYNSDIPSESKTNNVVTEEISSLACEETVTESLSPEKNKEIVENRDVAVSSEINSSDKVPENVAETDCVESKPAETSGSNNRKSLLSDLMELSGIWDDIDTSVTHENTAVPESTSTSIESVVPTNIVPPQCMPITVTSGPAIAPMPMLQPLSERVSEDIEPPELTPISSFAQLKYAVEHNGKFFKLDLELGTLSTGIKVCIKKQITKSVIDLTEEDDEFEAQIIRPTKPVTYAFPKILPKSLLKAQNTEGGPVKPLKLFRSVRILKKNKEHTVLLPAICETPTIEPKIKGPRKQNLENTRYDLKDAEVLDEDSLNSGSLDKYIYKDSDFLDTSELEEDSSDDEPLAFKAKRMRVNESSESNVDVQPAVQSGVADIEAPKDTQIEENPEVVPTAEVSAPEPDDHDLSNNLLQELPSNLMAFMPDNMDEEEEDCILGF